MTDPVKQLMLEDIYRHMETFQERDSLSETHTFSMNGNLIVDPNCAFYINLETPTTDFSENIEEVLWRIQATDNIDALPENSFIRKYAVTAESKHALFDTINKDLNNPESEIYQKHAAELGLDSFVGKISPLYIYTRVIPRIRASSVFYHNLPLSYDKESRLLRELESNEDFKKMDDKGREEYISNIIHKNNDLFHDQLSAIFFALQNKIFIDNPAQYVLHCVDPTARSLINSGDLLYTRNIFNNSYPFSQNLDSIQFLILNNRLNLKLNFNNFDVFNLFDVYYAMILLLIGDHVLGTHEPGLMYISSPLYTIKKEHLDFYKTMKVDDFDRYKVSFHPGPTFKDFSVTMPHQYHFTKV